MICTPNTFISGTNEHKVTLIFFRKVAYLWGSYESTKGHRFLVGVSTFLKGFHGSIDMTSRKVKPHTFR